jgi:peroxiredoxin family protein
MGRVIIFLRSGEYEALHQGVSVALAATALGRQVELYFFWWALEALVLGRLQEPFGLREEVASNLEARGVPTVAALLEQVRTSGHAQLFACSGSLAALGLTPPQVEPHVDQLIGWTSILTRTAGVTDRFFL